MGSFFSVVKLVLTVNIPFGAAVLTIFFWRRVNAPAVWACVILSTICILAVPVLAVKVPALRTSPGLVTVAADPSGKPVSVYFDSVVHENPDDLASRMIGTGRFNFECWLLDNMGFNVVALTPNQRFTATFFFDGIFPFVVLILVSLITPRTDPKRVAEFYGIMKTPVGDTPELEAAAVAETRRDPTRFDRTKLLPRSNWEFCKWDRVDTVGFIICSALSGVIVMIFIGVLKWAAR
jgi:hypothetical protein